jgi:hypothetical protein
VLVEIRPEPSEEGRAAILSTLERLLAEEGARDEGAPKWWAAGLRESLEAEEEGL